MTSYVGKLCKRGHNHENSGGSLRYSGNRGCVECKREKFPNAFVDAKPISRELATAAMPKILARSTRKGDCLECDYAGKYPLIRIEGRMYKCSRLVYVAAHGEIPPGMVIDHECVNPRCVEISHLRIATPQSNNQAKSMQSNNTSGEPNICWEKRRNKWWVRIKQNYRDKHIGYFDTIEEARAARDNAFARLVPEEDLPRW